MSDIVLKITPMPKPQNMRAKDGQKMYYKHKCGQRERKRLEYIAKYFTYCEELAWLAKQAGFTCPKILSLTFVIPVPKSKSQRKKDMLEGTPHQVKRRSDLSNLIKAFEDATYTGDVDDGEVWMYGRMQKIWGKEGQIIIHNTERQK